MIAEADNTATRQDRHSYGWPRTMKRRTAAAYLDLSLSDFDRQVSAGVLPAGFIFGRHLHWHTPDIDKAVDKLTGVGHHDWRIGSPPYSDTGEAPQAEGSKTKTSCDRER